MQTKYGRNEEKVPGGTSVDDYKSVKWGNGYRPGKIILAVVEEIHKREAL